MSELLFEIGAEELPENAINDTLAFFETRGAELATLLGVTSKVRVTGSPRRLF